MNTKIVEMVMTSKKNGINIYEFTLYQEYLKAYYQYQKENNSNFSHRNFSRAAGFSSPSYLNMVMSGKRKLTANSIIQFVSALGLGTREANYFETMVFFNQAKSEKERDYYLERMISLKPKVKLSPIQKDQYDFYSKKHYLVIHQMVCLPGFKEDYEWIAKNVYPAIKVSEAKEAIEALLRIDMLKRDGEGRLISAEESFATPPEVHSLEVKRYCRQMLSDAKEALIEVPRDQRDFTSLTIPVAIRDLEKFKQRILAFREEMNDWVNHLESPADEVFQLNIQLFPLTSLVWRKKIER